MRDLPPDSRGVEPLPTECAAPDDIRCDITLLLDGLEALETSQDFVLGHQRAEALLAAARAAKPVLWRTAPADGPLGMLRDQGPAVAAAAVRMAVAGMPGGGMGAGLAAYAIALLEFLDGRLAEARAAISRAATEKDRGGDNRARIARLAGAIHYALNDLTASESAYRTALTAYPGDPELLRNLARVLRAAGRLDESESTLQACLAQRPDFPEARTNLLMTFRARGASEEERQAAIALAGNETLSPRTRAAALASLLFLGEAERAVRAAVALVAAAPGDSAVLRAAAWTARQTGDRDTALRWLGALPEAERSAEDWLALALLVHDTAPEEALILARRGADPAPTLEAQFILRDLCEATGDKAAASRYDAAIRAVVLASGIPGTDAPQYQRARSYAAFFDGQPILRTPDPVVEPPPPVEETIRHLDPSVRRTVLADLRNDHALWSDGIAAGGPTDFSVLIAHRPLAAGAGVATAHIVGDGAYVNHRISQVPPQGAAVTQALLRSPVCGPDMPDWVIRSGSLPETTIEDAIFIGGHENYGHFLWEVLSRTVAARCLPGAGEQPLCVLLHAPYQAEMLKVMAPGRPVIPLTPAPGIVRFRRSLAPRDLSYWSSIRQTTTRFRRWAGDDGDGPKRLFLSRANHKPFRHRIANEEALRERLDRFGFVTVFPDRLSMRDTVRLFGGARVVVGASGAHFANTPFCRPGTRIVELAARYHALDRVWHWTLPYMFGYPQVEHRRVYGRDVSIEPGTALNWLTYYDPDAVEAAVAAMLD